MVTELFSDNTSGTLIAPASQGTLTLQVNTLTGVFPIPTAGQQFHVAINSGNSTAELGIVTTNASGTFTLSSPLGFNHNAGELVALVVSAAGLASLVTGGGGTVSSVSGTTHQISSTGGTTPVLSFPTNGIVLPALAGGHLTTQGGTTLDDGAGNATVGNALVVTTTITGPSYNSNAHSGTTGIWSDSAKVSGGIQLGRGIGGSSKSTGMLDGPYVGIHSGPEPPLNASAFATGDLYFGITTGSIWRWSGSAWVLIYLATTSGQTAPFFSASLTGTGRFVGGGTAAPVSGTYVAGDFIIDPSGQQIWVCTTGGTPGTWAAFGSTLWPNAGQTFNASQTLTTAVAATLNQWTSAYTAQAMTLTATGFTIITPGTYIVNANIPVSWTGSSTDDDITLTLNKNGSATGMPFSSAAAVLTGVGGTNKGSAIINWQGRFAAADTVSLSAVQSEGISAVVAAGGTFSLSMVSR